MKRSPLARRTPLRRGSRRVGQAARERVQAGGKLALGRDSETRDGYRALVSRLLERARRRCEWSGVRGLLDPAHIRARSAGGADEEDNLVMLARAAHDLMSAPYARGRLLVAPLGQGRFCFRLVRGAHKWAPKTVESHEHTPTLAWLRAGGLRAGLRLDRLLWNGDEVARCPRRCG